MTVTDLTIDSNCDVIKALQALAESSVIDVDRTILGSELFYRPTFSDEEIDVIKVKIFEIIKRL